MTLVKFELPILVRYNKKAGYSIRPLFLKAPVAIKKRYRKAYDSFVNILIKVYRNTHVNRQEINELLWYKFNPELKFSQVHLSFLSGKLSVSQNFSVTTFKVNGHVIAHFPDFNDYMSVLEGTELNDQFVQEQISDIIKTLVRNARKDKGDEFRKEDYESVKGEFVTKASLIIPVINKLFFEKPDKLFDLLFQEISFIGYNELYKVGYSLNSLYPGSLQPAWFVEDMTKKIEQILFKKEPAVIAVVGEKGTGKTTIIHAALYNYLSRFESHYASYVREIFHIDPNRIIAGMSLVGMWQKRLESILETIIRWKKIYYKEAPDILFFDNPVALLRIGKSSQNNMTLSDLFKPYLEKRIIPFIIEATPEEWKVIQDMDRRFADMFQVIRIREVDYEKAVDINLRKRTEIESEFPFRLNNDAMMKLFSLHRLYMQQNALPGSTISYMQQLASKYRGDVNEAEIMSDFSERSSIRREIFNQNIIEQDEIQNRIKQRLIGQKSAVDAISDIIHVINANLNDPDKPMASLLFIGPTGVGKTQAAKVMADYLFDSEENMVRFDMNEYIDAGSVKRLIGDFYNPEGQLTGRVRYNPFCVLLLDEIEKAHPDVHDLLLQVLGEGRLTDSAGNTVDFTNTITIMTSNLGASRVGKELGYVKTEESVAQTYRKAVEDFFRPEMLNRIDDVIVFSKLNKEEIISIADIMISELLQREGFIRRTTILKVQPNVLKNIAETGFDPELGARALKRNIEKDVIELVANYMIDYKVDTPILFEMFLEKNKLVPRITAFRNIETVGGLNFPVADEENSHKEMINLMLEKLYQMQKDMMNFREKEEAALGIKNLGDLKDTKMLVLTDEIRGMISRAENDLIDMEAAGRHKAGTNIGFKVRGYANSVNNLLLYNFHKLIYDYYKQIEIKDYFEELYKSMVNVVSMDDEYMFDYYIKLSYLNYFWQGLKNRQTDHLCIHIKPLIQKDNVMEKAMGMLLFDKLWNSWHFNKAILDSSGKTINGARYEDKDHFLFFNGPKLYELLKNEEGIHLFFIDNRFYPVSVSVERIEEETTYSEYIQTTSKVMENKINKLKDGSISIKDIPGISGRVIRIYVINSQNSKNNIITDLKTGTMIKHNIDYHDAELLMSANIPDKYKPF